MHRHNSAVVVAGVLLGAIGCTEMVLARDLGYEFVLAWGEPGSGEGQFDFLKGLAVDADGNVYVADYSNHRIQKFTNNGTYVTQWGSYGSSDGEFRYPRNVAVSSSGEVYVVDSFNHRIQKFTSNGTYVTQWGSHGSGDGEFSLPAGVAVDADGDLYVSDMYNHRVQKFTSNGTYITQWGTEGTGDGEFVYPLSMASGPGGVIYVGSEFGASGRRVQKFTSEGDFLLKWDSYGGSDGDLRSINMAPQCDAQGNVYIADFQRPSVGKFTSDGVFLGWLGKSSLTTGWHPPNSGQVGMVGTGEGEFMTPTGVAVDADGNLYVNDESLNRIQKFRPLTIEERLRQDAEIVRDYPLELFEGKNDKQRLTRHDWLIKKLTMAANKVEGGDYGAALDQLNALLLKIDDLPNPPDWMVSSTEKTELRVEVEDVIELLEFLL